MYCDPTLTGGVNHPILYMCECEENGKHIDNFIPLELRLARMSAAALQKYEKALKKEVGTEDYTLKSDSFDPKWIPFNIHSNAWWLDVRPSDDSVLSGLGRTIEKSQLTDMLPIKRYPWRVREADWGDWPAVVPEGLDPIDRPQNERPTSMMTRFYRQALRFGAKGFFS